MTFLNWSPEDIKRNLEGVLQETFCLEEILMNDRELEESKNNSYHSLGDYFNFINDSTWGKANCIQSKKQMESNFKNIRKKSWFSKLSAVKKMINKSQIKALKNKDLNKSFYYENLSFLFPCLDQTEYLMNLPTESHKYSIILADVSKVLNFRF
jgi:hypothetical protein